jgi:two-component system sensor histidine kinase RegB
MATWPGAAEHGSSRLRLDTLVRLRWLAVAGQAAAVVIVGFVLRFPMPIAECFALIALSALVNIVLRLRLRGNVRLQDRWSALLLAYDVAQLGGLLALTGGLENPFAILLLVPVVVSATTLRPRLTALLGGLTLALATLLAFIHLPLPSPPSAPVILPSVYVAGIWVALVCTVLFMGIYAFRVAEEARQLAEALAATELVLTREQHLSALDGLAAAAAHELGTPLATIALVAKELEREMPADSSHGEDIALLRSQVQRCRDILAKLNSLSADADWHHSTLPLSQLIEEAVAPYREFGVAIHVVRPGGRGPEPVGRRNPGILYGLGNLVENAVDFARTEVTLNAQWTPDEVNITIADDGPGFAPEVIDRIGEPYLTTRARSRASETGSEQPGLGLGLFIAKTLLERSGAKLSFTNIDPPGAGAAIRIVWPRAAMEASSAEAEIAPVHLGETPRNTYKTDIQAG